ncbi:hypothetical protein HNQ59_001142 [Chitinivorax tropicus]|uniref:Uncharacterized protein n=1 Tax=Chitinivorax tropicus TaxID=714531 RepID=A0A840MMD0_9PROT|nr:hypothetical protein [Chitinivorax tropicus]MBB5017872.1 hypothetical protein [Chitinivorax tropicus]
MAGDRTPLVNNIDVVTLTNSPGVAGNYLHYQQVLNADGSSYCDTNMIYLNFANI